jgi:hypothetical protein
MEEEKEENEKVAECGKQMHLKNVSINHSELDRANKANIEQN